MPPTGTNEGIEAAKEIRAAHPTIGVVVLSQFVEEDYAFDLLKDGAAGLGYLLKERVADVDELVRALGEVARGGSVLDPKVVEALVSAKERMAHSPLAQLTRIASARCFRTWRRVRNNAAIAKPLFLTERAVEKHINSLFHKSRLTVGTGRPPPGDGGTPAYPPRDRRRLARPSCPSRVHDEDRARRVSQDHVRRRRHARATVHPVTPRLPTTIVSASSSAATSQTRAIGRCATPRRGRG